MIFSTYFELGNAKGYFQISTKDTQAYWGLGKETVSFDWETGKASSKEDKAVFDANGICLKEASKICRDAKPTIRTRNPRR